MLVTIEVTAPKGTKVGSTFRKVGWSGKTDERIAKKLIEKKLATSSATKAKK